MSEALPHRPSAWGAGPGRAPPYVRIMAMYMSCAVAPTRSTRSARYEKTYRAPQRTYHRGPIIPHQVGGPAHRFENLVEKDKNPEEW